MIDGAYAALSALDGFSKKLAVVSNNVANSNTDGFKPRLCSRHLLRPEKPCCNARFTILLLNIFINMPSAQNRSNFAFRWGF